MSVNNLETRQRFTEGAFFKKKKKDFFSSQKRRKKKTRTKTKKNLIYLSPSILHCPFPPSLFMKHTQDGDKRHRGNMATRRKWKELVQDVSTGGEALLSGSRSDIKSPPSCARAGRGLAQSGGGGEPGPCNSSGVSQARRTPLDGSLSGAGNLTGPLQ